MATKKTCSIVMVFGSSATSAYEDEGVKGLKKALATGDGDIVRHQFGSEAERNAYLQGLEDGNGWEEYTSVEPADLEKHEAVFRKLLHE